MAYKEENKTVVDALVLDIPGVKGGKAFGYPAYKVKGKVFAFVGEVGIALKLPEDRVAELVNDQAEIRPFEVTDGVIWKQWVYIERKNAEDYRQDVSLMEEAIAFVGAQG